MTDDRTGEPRPTLRRVLVDEAAEALGISEGAVRMRVKRGTLPSEREGGRLYVLLNTDPTTDQDRTHGGTHDRTDELIGTLREQLQAERQAHAEARRLLAAALERIPALEAPADSATDAPGSPEQGEAGEDRGNVPTESQHVDVATNTEEGKPREDMTARRQARIGFVLTVVSAFIGFLGAVVSAGGDSLSGTISTIGTAFSTAISSGLSSISGDQAVTIVSSLITVIGTVAATYLGIRWRGRGRDQ